MNRPETNAKPHTAIEDRGGRAVARSLIVAPRSAGPSTLSPPPRVQPESTSGCEPSPVWLTALMAVNCQAKSNDLHHTVRWHSVSGRAVYTNFGSHTERIEPLGVTLPAGETLAVYWLPGETAYTIEVYSDTEKCA
jgi:hypothetical protein